MISTNTKFRFLHQKGGGIILSVNKNGTYHVLLDEGFEADVKQNEIVEIKTEFLDFKAVKNKDEKPAQNISKPAAKVQTPVLDLHLSKNSNHEFPLERQMSYFKVWINECLSKHVESAIVIHGDGDGILKNTIHKSLKANPKVKKFSQADAFKFGTGATQIWFL